MLLANPQASAFTNHPTILPVILAKSQRRFGCLYSRTNEQVATTDSSIIIVGFTELLPCFQMLSLRTKFIPPDGYVMQPMLILLKRPTVLEMCMALNEVGALLQGVILALYF